MSPSTTVVATTGPTSVSSKDATRTTLALPSTSAAVAAVKAADKPAAEKPTTLAPSTSSNIPTTKAKAARSSTANETRAHTNSTTTSIAPVAFAANQTGARSAADSATDLDWLLHLSIGLAVAGAFLIFIAGLIVFVRRRKSRKPNPFGVNSTGNGSLAANAFHDTCWDDISLHYIDNPAEMRKDSLDDLASIDNDSFLNSLNQLMFEKARSTIGSSTTASEQHSAIVTTRAGTQHVTIVSVLDDCETLSARSSAASTTPIIPLSPPILTAASGTQTTATIERRLPPNGDVRRHKHRHHRQQAANGGTVRASSTNA